MRKLVIALSVLFFALSGIITFKTLSIPARDNHLPIKTHEAKSKVLMPEPVEASETLSEEQSANRTLVEELQSTIAKLEGELSQKNEKAPVEVETAAAEKKVKVLAVIGAGAFRSGQVAINEDLRDAVNKLVPEIRASADHRVIIEGHTDNIPISLSAGLRYRDNMELSFLRAKAVADILVDFGLPLERISVIGYGDTRPISSNDTAAGRIKNRRVEVKLSPDNKEF